MRSRVIPASPLAAMHPDLHPMSDNVMERFEQDNKDFNEIFGVVHQSLSDQFPTEEQTNIPMKKIRLPYRSASHLALLHIVSESWGWKKQGLAVEYDFYVDPEKAYKFFKSGKMQFIGGDHITPYIKPATVDDCLYVDQLANYLSHASCATRKNFKLDAGAVAGN